MSEMNSDPVSQALAIAEALSGNLDGMSRSLGEMKKDLAATRESNTKTNVRLWIVIVGFMLDIILTIVLTIVLFNQVDQGHQLKQVQDKIHVSQIQACTIGNAYRTQQIQLWYTLINLSKENPQPHMTPAQKAIQARILSTFLAAVRKTYAPIDCSRLYNIK